MTPFNRVVVPPANLASFLRTEEGEELTFTELQSLLYDRLYRTGAVRLLNGDRAHRRRARDRRNRSQSRRRSQTRSRRRTQRAGR